MSYSIVYHPELNGKYPRRKQRKNRGRIMKYGIAALIAVGILWGFREEILDVVIPGDNAVTTAAVSKLTENVRAGEPVHDSLVTFCEAILENGS